MRDGRRRGSLSMAVFLFLVYGAVAYWLWVLFTKARLSPDWRVWGPPFLAGGSAGLLLMLLGGMFRRRREPD